jgi:hypothetical protein
VQRGLTGQGRPVWRGHNGHGSLRRHDTGQHGAGLGKRKRGPGGPAS